MLEGRIPPSSYSQEMEVVGAMESLVYGLTNLEVVGMGGGEDESGAVEEMLEKVFFFFFFSFFFLSFFFFFFFLMSSWIGFALGS